MSSFTLSEINRKEAHKAVTRPFNPRLEADTTTRYIQVWQQILCYLLRTYPIPSGQRPAYQLTSLQRELLQELLHQARPGQKAFWQEDRFRIRTDQIDRDRNDVIRDESDDNREESDENSEYQETESEEDDQSQPDVSRQKREEKSFMCGLDRTCLRFCISLLNQQLLGNDFTSPLLSGLAVLGVDTTSHVL